LRTTVHFPKTFIPNFAHKKEDCFAELPQTVWFSHSSCLADISNVWSPLV